MNFSFVFQLYFSSAINYVQLNYKFLPSIQHSLATSKLVVPRVSSRTHPKKQSKSKEKTCAILGGRAQKDVFPFTQEKNGGRVQKIEKNDDFRRTSTCNEKLVICVCSKTHCCDIVPVKRIIVKDTTLTTQCFFVCFIFIGLITTSI